MNDKLQKALAIVEKYGMKGDVIYKEIEALAASKPEPQAQAGDPEVVAWIGVFKDAKGNPRKLPLEHRPDEGTQLALLGAKFFPLITLQSHREAMAEAVRVVQDDWELDVRQHREALAKKDAALQACVEALKEVNEWRLTGIGRPPEQTSMDAITQAEEAMR